LWDEIIRNEKRYDLIIRRRKKEKDVGA